MAPTREQILRTASEAEAKAIGLRRELRRARFAALESSKAAIALAQAADRADKQGNSQAAQQLIERAQETLDHARSKGESAIRIQFALAQTEQALVPLRSALLSNNTVHGEFERQIALDLATSIQSKNHVPSIPAGLRKLTERKTVQLGGFIQDVGKTITKAAEDVGAEVQRGINSAVDAVAKVGCSDIVRKIDSIERAAIASYAQGQSGVNVSSVPGEALDVIPGGVLDTMTGGLYTLLRRRCRREIEEALARKSLAVRTAPIETTIVGLKRNAPTLILGLTVAGVLVGGALALRAIKR